MISYKISMIFPFKIVHSCYKHGCPLDAFMLAEYTVKTECSSKYFNPRTENEIVHLEIHSIVVRPH